MRRSKYNLVGKALIRKLIFVTANFRGLLVINDQLRNAEAELATKQASLKARIDSPRTMKKDEQTIKVLQNQLEKSLKTLNDLQSENKNHRKEIDVCRKEQGVQDKVISGYNKEIKSITERVKTLNKTTQSSSKGSQDTNNQILALKAKHDLDKFNFEHRITDLQIKLQEKDEDQAENRTRTKDMNATKGGASAAEFANPAELLRIRLNKVVNNNKEKKNLMDMYIRNVNIIRDAFDQIKESSGIASNEEIVTSFIKSEEQNNSLVNYINGLGGEIDMIEMQNRNIEEEIKRHEIYTQMNDKDKIATKANLEKEIAEMKENYKQKQTQIEDIEYQMTHIKDYAWSMVDKFAESRFQLAVASHMTYDDDVQFNENNVTQYLTELEEYMSQFITFLAHREKNPDAHISALPLDIMTNKEFAKDPMSIDAPNTNDYAEDDVTADEDIVTNAAEKYRKYEELARQGYFGAA